ncbi:MAG TPA: hypothetical protein VMU66_06100 [Gaiellales bacterium]|nr:hypothetical protein [Gaiellales bacterium]
MAGLATCTGLGLWRGGFFAPAQLTLVAVVGAAVVARRPAAGLLHDWVAAGLVLSAAANFGSLVLVGGAPAAALVTAALPLAYL